MSIQARRIPDLILATGGQGFESPWIHPRPHGQPKSPLIERGFRRCSASFRESGRGRTAIPCETHNGKNEGDQDRCDTADDRRFLKSSHCRDSQEQRRIDLCVQRIEHRVPGEITDGRCRSRREACADQEGRKHAEISQ